MCFLFASSWSIMPAEDVRTIYLEGRREGGREEGGRRGGREGGRDDM